MCYFVQSIGSFIIGYLTYVGKVWCSYEFKLCSGNYNTMINIFVFLY